MKHNVGATGRTVRILLGVGLLSTVVLVEGSTRWLGLLGVVPLLTGVLGNCPAYSVFGWSSCPVARAKM
jgi:hypothetical protein